MRNIDWWNDNVTFNYIILYIKRFDVHFEAAKFVKILCRGSVDFDATLRTIFKLKKDLRTC